MTLIEREWHPDSRRKRLGARVHVRERTPKTLLRPGGCVHSDHFTVEKTDIWFWTTREARDYFQAMLPLMVARYMELAEAFIDWRREDEKV